MSFIKIPTSFTQISLPEIIKEPRDPKKRNKRSTGKKRHKLKVKLEVNNGKELSTD